MQAASGRSKNLTQKPTWPIRPSRATAFKTDNGRSVLAAGTGLHAPKATLPGPDDRSEETSKRPFDRAASCINPGRWAIVVAVPSGAQSPDRLGKKLCCAIFRRLPPSLAITVSGHNQDWQVGEPLLDLPEQWQPVPYMLMRTATSAGSISLASRSSAAVPEVA